MHDKGTSAGRRHVFGQPDEGAASVHEGCVLHGSVTGRLSLAEGASVYIDGVLEEVVLHGKGTVHVAGLIVDHYTSSDLTLMASPGSVLAPYRSDECWHVLNEDGTWGRSPGLVFPDASIEGPWFPVPRTSSL